MSSQSSASETDALYVELRVLAFGFGDRRLSFLVTEPLFSATVYDSWPLLGEQSGCELLEVPREVCTHCVMGQMMLKCNKLIAAPELFYKVHPHHVDAVGFRACTDPST